ncbi:hypothetical protein QNA08_12655 [Chelatococcus sp. SYSU_G07232]|uniref:Uncharacterized protein n=1 Tax=Chelatococcus albus TaxID=3047466 RepID=A0ABT7AI75_9HYPH|nr:hypothetical protein [Chelatococcus sp. SYSU_G07232]MDJ1159087.1 hypothetical protein [Chelatococcus sp. SYSU_G07232]
MAEVRINAGATYVFAAGQLEDTLELDNRHNVNGNVLYQIGAAPQVTVPIVPNEEYTINNIRGQQVTVQNGLPNSLYCVW